MALQETFVDGKLTVTNSHAGGDDAVIAFAGRLDGANVETAEEAFVTAILARYRIVVVDLRRLESLAPEGLDLLVEMSDLHDFGRRLRLIPSTSPAVASALHRSGLGERIPAVAAPVG